jgi:kynurenine 3-monooxygenase
MADRITIVGGGLVGALLGTVLAKRGMDVHIFERRPDMRASTMSAGRSINLAMSDRGLRALEVAGIADE